MWMATQRKEHIKHVITFTARTNRHTFSGHKVLRQHH